MKNVGICITFFSFFTAFSMNKDITILASDGTVSITQRDYNEIKLLHELPRADQTIDGRRVYTHKDYYGSVVPICTKKNIKHVVQALNMLRSAKKQEWYQEKINHPEQLRAFINVAGMLCVPKVLASLGKYYFPQEIQQLIGVHVYTVDPLINCSINKTAKRLEGHPSSVTAVAWSSDNTLIASGCFGNKDNLIVWDATTGTIKYKLEGHPSHVFSVSWNSDNTSLVSGCSRDKDNLIVWTMDSEIIRFLREKLDLEHVCLLNEMHNNKGLIEKDDVYYGVYKNMPEDVQSLLQEFFMKK